MSAITAFTSPDVTLAYNEGNQVTSMSDPVLGATAFGYTAAGHLETENGPWDSDTVTVGYHATAPGLRTGLTVQQPSGTWAQTYAYDAARRLQTLTGPAGTFAYTYRGPGNLWTNLALPSGAAITNHYDSAARLTGTWLRKSDGTILNKHLYLYNGGGQRSRQTRFDGSYLNYGYDDDAQLQSSLGYTSGGTPIASEQLGYAYDTA